MRGIKKRGLNHNVDIITLPGRTSDDIFGKLRSMDISRYSKIVVYAGGNDISNGRPIEQIKSNVVDSVLSLQENHTRSVYMCIIAPRRDVNVLEFNGMLRKVQSEFSIGLIDCYNAFVLGNGRSARHLFSNDDIHPNLYGSSTLVSSINEIVQISKQQRTDPDNSWQRPSYNRYQHGPHLRRQNLSCTNCGRTNHATRECRVQRRW